MKLNVSNYFNVICINNSINIKIGIYMEKKYLINIRWEINLSRFFKRYWHSSAIFMQKNSRCNLYLDKSIIWSILECILINFFFWIHTSQNLYRISWLIASFLTSSTPRKALKDVFFHLSTISHKTWITF